MVVIKEESSNISFPKDHSAATELNHYYIVRSGESHASSIAVLWPVQHPLLYALELAKVRCICRYGTLWDFQLVVFQHYT